MNIENINKVINYIEDMSDDQLATMNWWEETDCLTGIVKQVFHDQLEITDVPPGRGPIAIRRALEINPTQACYLYYLGPYYLGPNSVSAFNALPPAIKRNVLVTALSALRDTGELIIKLP